MKTHLDAKKLNLVPPHGRFYRRLGGDNLREITLHDCHAHDSVRPLGSDDLRVVPRTDCVMHTPRDYALAFRKYTASQDTTELVRHHQLMLRAIEVSRSFEPHHTMLTTAAELAVDHMHEYFFEFVLAAMLLTETHSSDKKHLSRLFDECDVWDKAYNRLRTLRLTRGLPMTLIGLESHSSIIDYQSMLTRFLSPTVVRDWRTNKRDKNVMVKHPDLVVTEPMMLAHLALEFARAKSVHQPDVKHCLLGMAPFAERYGFTRMANEFRELALRGIMSPEQRDQIYEGRLINNRSLPETENIIANFRDIVFDALTEALSREKVISVRARIKGAYSIWEKQQTKDAVSEDLYGLEILVANTEAIWETVRLIKDAVGLNEPGKQMSAAFSDVYHAIQNGKVRTEKDDITRPRESGYSAYTLLRQFYNGYPIEIKITTPDRDKINKSLQAAHWRYKTERSLKAVAPNCPQDLNCAEPRTDERLILIGEKPQGLFEIKRIPREYRRVSDLAEHLKSPVQLQRAHTARGSLESVFISPVKAKVDFKLRDGMIFYLPPVAE